MGLTIECFTPLVSTPLGPTRILTASEQSGGSRSRPGGLSHRSSWVGRVGCRLTVYGALDGNENLEPRRRGRAHLELETVWVCGGWAWLACANRSGGEPNLRQPSRPEQPDPKLAAPHAHSPPPTWVRSNNPSRVCDEPNRAQPLQAVVPGLPQSNPGGRLQARRRLGVSVPVRSSTPPRQAPKAPTADRLPHPPRRVSQK